MSEPKGVQFARACDACGGYEGDAVRTWVGGFMVTDVWTCRCGVVFHQWRWESTMQAAREARAALEKTEVAQPEEIPEKKGQMGLF